MIIIITRFPAGSVSMQEKLNPGAKSRRAPPDPTERTFAAPQKAWASCGHITTYAAEIARD
jgi:hypothetical protein